MAVRKGADEVASHGVGEHPVRCRWVDGTGAARRMPPATQAWGTHTFLEEHRCLSSRAPAATDTFATDTSAAVASAAIVHAAVAFRVVVSRQPEPRPSP